MTPQMLSHQNPEGKRIGLATIDQAQSFEHKVLITACERAFQVQFPARTVWQGCCTDVQRHLSRQSSSLVALSGTSHSSRDFVLTHLTHLVRPVKCL